ncbi:HAD family hydrolase [Brachybacterium kimchii]|uniref:HAD family phosphatase n=1 Tax=Brachybacterium kimchii TaxID=2942909 RepID=A0ABY4NCI9_9MICO|nr:HAD family phosphatase [Brachybacterium kimchii]UQN31180.1 HAD family phosphatase [Brachybacterium kimchii]
MSRKRRGTSAADPKRITVVFDFGGVLSAGHDPVPTVHELLGGDAETVGEALWEHRGDYDAGRIDAAEYWGRVAAAAGIENLTETEVRELQSADNRYFLQLDQRSRELLHDLARNGMRMALLSNASAAFGEDVRRADWFEAFTLAVISAEEKLVKPDAEIYRILLDVLAHENGGVARPGDVVFFDDRADNVEAARALGIDAHLWPRNGEDGAAEHGATMARRVLEGRGVPLS